MDTKTVITEVTKEDYVVCHLFPNSFFKNNQFWFQEGNWGIVSFLRFYADLRKYD